MPNMYPPRSAKKSDDKPEDSSLEEFLAGLPKLPYPELVAPLPNRSIEETISALDSNKDGAIQPAEYLARREDYIEVRRNLLLKEMAAIAEKNSGFSRKPSMDIKGEQLEYLNNNVERIEDAIKGIPNLRGITVDIGNGITEPKVSLDSETMTLILHDDREIAKKIINELGTMKTPILPNTQVKTPSQDKAV